VKRTIRVLCRPPLAAGFALAGLHAASVAGGAEAAERVRAIARDPDVGVLLVEDTLHDALPPELRRQLARRPLPMVVPFPGPTWAERAAAAEAYVVELLRQVIGYRVRVR
jgi:vacuolar-type H+-ATPase subunit F/Vma7